MARQGINPLEQHVEKAVFGLSVLVFAFVVFTYVISTPVTVHVGGQSLSPADLDRTLGQTAEQIASIYRSARLPQQAETGPSAVPALAEVKNAQDSLKKPWPAMVSPVWPAPQVPVPKGSGLDLQDKHGLASVGAPVITGVYTGVTYAGLVTQPSPLGEVNAAPATTNQDVVWAFLRLSFDMQEQYEVFRQNNYSREQANAILFLDVQAQRQRVFPDGTTGPWEDFSSYKTVQVNYPASVTIQEDGSLSYNDDEAMRALLAGLVQDQQSILYPLPQIVGGDPFPPYGIPTPTAESAASFTPPVRNPALPPGRSGPSRLPGRSPSRFEGERPPSRGGSGEAGPARGGGPRGGAPSFDRDATLRATRAIQEARRAFAEKRYSEALRFLEDAHNAPTAFQRQIAELQAQIEVAYAAWKESEDQAQARKASEEARNAELWVYDMHAPAGRTYRYRARVVLLNVYAHPAADRLGELTDPRKGSQVALVGEWSAPADPITLADTRYFFFTGGQPEKEQAAVEVFRFQQGRWFKDRQPSLTIGDSIGEIRPAAAGRPEVDYRTGRVVVDIGTDPLALVPASRTGKPGLAIRPVSSPMLISMDADGSIEPRWSAVDRVCPMYKELDARWKASSEQPLAGAVGPRGS